MILEAISKGKNHVSEISNEIGIPVQNLPKYLCSLINLGFAAKE
jgi:DNA-binding IclR family transcriptional regulator